MHLDAWVIEALEAGDYERIGPAVYAKGHLKKYASILGVAPADIAAGHDTPPMQPVAAAFSTHPSGCSHRRPNRSDWPWPQVAAFAVIALACRRHPLVAAVAPPLEPARRGGRDQRRRRRARRRVGRRPARSPRAPLAPMEPVAPMEPNAQRAACCALGGRLTRSRCEAAVSAASGAPAPASAATRRLVENDRRAERARCPARGRPRAASPELFGRFVGRRA